MYRKTTRIKKAHTITFEPTVDELVEEERGDLNRSSFLNHLIKKIYGIESNPQDAQVNVHRENMYSN